MTLGTAGSGGGATALLCERLDAVDGAGEGTRPGGSSSILCDPLLVRVYSVGV